MDSSKQQTLRVIISIIILVFSVLTLLCSISFSFSYASLFGIFYAMYTLYLLTKKNKQVDYGLTASVVIAGLLFFLLTVYNAGYIFDLYNVRCQGPGGQLNSCVYSMVFVGKIVDYIILVPLVLLIAKGIKRK